MSIVLGVTSIKRKEIHTVRKPYPLLFPVSGSVMSWIWSIFPNGSKIPLNISSVILKCNEPTYSLVGPLLAFGAKFGKELPTLFFSACVCCTIIGTPSNFWPVNPRAWKYQTILILCNFHAELFMLVEYFLIATERNRTVITRYLYKN